MIEEEVYQLKIRGGAAESKIGVHHQSLIVPPALVKLHSVEFVEHLKNQNSKKLRLEVQATLITSETISLPPSLIVPNKSSIICTIVYNCGKVITLAHK